MAVRKLLIAFLMTICSGSLYAQDKIKNLILITADGLRWQEVFGGVDISLASDKRFNENDSLLIYQNYHAVNAEESRKRIFPFLWSEFAQNGRLYGNRDKGTKVNNANPYWFSYPGYSELLTGYVDLKVNSNDYPENPNTSLLGFLQKQADFKGKIAAFGAWNAFDRILNEKAAGFPVVSAFDKAGGEHPSAEDIMRNRMLADSYKPWNQGECLDVFTHYAAMEYLKKKDPRVLYIAYGETDEWAHSGKYRSYLDAAHQLDAWLKEIWTYVQSNSQYRDKTALMITVDHGRGTGEGWTSHGSKVEGSDQTWFAVLAPGITGRGEITGDMQLYQKQLARTMASLLGVNFTAEHPVEDGVPGISKAPAPVTGK